jgi:hypothetical protein
MNDIMSKLRAGLMYYRTDVRNIYRSDDIVIQRFLKVKKIKKLI